MQLSRRGYDDTARKRFMTKKHLALAASLMALVAISGPAFAGATKANPGTEIAGPSAEQAARIFKASHAAMTPEAAVINTHPYHGGPKYND
jgi:hypothetical protein